MMLTKPLFAKGSFFGSLINRVRTNPIASISIGAPVSEPAGSSNSLAKAKTYEEKVGLPPRPKKPLTPYFRFMKEMRSKVLEKNPNLKSIDIVRTLTKEWETVDSNVKNRFINEYERDKKAYLAVRVKYDAQITDEQKAEIKQLKQAASEAKERRSLRKRIKELGRPKRPASAFLRFISEERKSMPQKSDETFKEWHKKATEKWSRLPDSEKERYIEQSRKEMESYKQEISVWEQKMVRMGNVDVVRFGSLIDPPEPTQKSNPKTSPKTKKQ